MAQLVDRNVLKQLVPPNALNAENFQELARKAVVETLPAGRTIFKTGDRDGKTIYVIAGEVELTTGDGQNRVVKGGTADARHPIGNFQPRQHTARARTEVSITRFDSDLLDILLTWDQLSGIEVSDLTSDNGEPAEAGDWMSRILQSSAFMSIPPANIQQMFMKLQEFPAKAGDVIVEQGGEGDYYYIISEGRCKVTRRAPNGQELPLAELIDGDAFGEEALLSNEPRNATVRAVTDSKLMRLSKQDFEELLKAPMQKEVDFEKAKEMVRAGSTQLIDVRLESEHQNSAIKGSVNIPIYMLRLKAEGLPKDRDYIVYCDTGRRSSAAAYLLTERGLNAYVLEGGLTAVKEARAAAG
ncbi:MAG: cyclic nucleotide-binding domain-containing protein [Gammaproteobacteria bacterium]|nr:cyclic nucleotide-binding domain-containing protein [Gammaproteobacteria bacterium]